jgi:hypothetical protein
MPVRRHGERHTIPLGLGLHRLKRKLQKRLLAKQCRELVGCLGDALAATVAAAPVRTKPYIIERQRAESLDRSEARWEEALFWSWKRPPFGSVPWRRLLTYQVRLSRKGRHDEWGEIDLLGVSDRNLPVVVELRAPGSIESPAHMLVEAAAYGVAVRKAWRECLRDEWAKAVGMEVSSLPEELPACQLVCAAPAEYWDNWTGNSPRARAVQSDVWSAIADLRKSLEQFGYPSTFLRLQHRGTAKHPVSIWPVEEILPG